MSYNHSIICCCVDYSVLMNKDEIQPKYSIVVVVAIVFSCIGMRYNHSLVLLLLGLEPPAGARIR